MVVRFQGVSRDFRVCLGISRSFQEFSAVFNGFKDLRRFEEVSKGI